MKVGPVLLIVAILIGSGHVAAQKQIAVASASDLSYALPELTAKFEAQTGAHVTVSLGSSGNFYSQIRNGAPFDVFMSADVKYAQQLQDAGFTSGPPRKYAVGQLVLWTTKASGINVGQGISALSDERVKKIAIANPEHAPYGRAAVSTLQRYGLYDKVRSKLVVGENISQTAQFAQTGNAQVGFVALSLALAPQMVSAGTYWMVPADAHPAIEQAAVVLKGSSQQDSAKRFVEFLGSTDAHAIFRKYGFAIPEAK